jgi:hypothetical protein
MVHMSLLRGWGVCALGSVLLLAPGLFDGGPADDGQGVCTG